MTVEKLPLAGSFLISYLCSIAFLLSCGAIEQELILL